MKWISEIGRIVISTVDYIGGVLIFSVKTFAAMFPPWPKHRLLARHMLLMGVETLPVSGLIIFFVGMVITFQTAYQMRPIGGEEFLPGLVAVSMTRELGPVLTAIVIAGRVGAAITAELGTMKVTEQVEAIEASAVNPIKFLVSPRLLAIALMMPILTIYTDIMGLMGGYVVTVWKLGITHDYFFESAFQVMTTGDIITGLIKSVVFGSLVCIVSCYEGLSVVYGAQGVGRSTMRSVVFSFILIIIADFFFTVLFYIWPF